MSGDCCMSGKDRLDDYLPVEKGEFLEGFCCPRCGESEDELMGRPAVKVRGYNTESGILLDCQVCNSSLTEAEIRLGVRNPWNQEGLMDDFEPTWNNFIPNRELSDELSDTASDHRGDS